MGDTEPLSRVVGPRDVRALDLERGRVLDGRYEIRRRIGSGGMGVVYAARRLALGDIVALKQLAPVSDSQYNRSRFLLEARSAAHIRHPNVVEIYDFGNSPDQPPYIVMEYIEGPTLSQVLRRGRLPVARALEIFHPLCSAIEAGHRRGIVHRDLKPANIILATSDDGLEIVKVLDFGLAFVAAGGAERLTQPGSIVGTARYMAPEQARSEDVTPATDIFTLGILLYEMVTGQVPFLAKTPVLTALKISEGEYEPPETLVPSLPRPLVQAITQALRQDPAQRPQTPGELARQAAEGDARSPTAVPTKPAGDSLTAAPQADRPADLEALSFDHFVGRERQLRRLREELDHAVRGPGRVVLVVGDPGAGKTRLVEHFTAQIQAEQPAVVLWGRFFDYGGSRRPPYESFINILREGSKGQADDRRIRIATEAAAAGRLDADSGRWRFFTAVTEAFAARAEQGPMILALDDIQWATSADLELIDHLQRSLGHRRTLVVVTARESDTRPESGTELASWILRLGARRAHAQLAVGHFAEGEIRTWLHQGFGGLHIHPRDLKRLATVTGANPYCLVEVTRHLLATGAIDWQDGWRCQPLDDVALPETVANLVRTRLQGLSKGLRQVLETAAVVGAEMRFETLQKATGVSESKLEALVEEATRRLLLRDHGVSRGNDYRFANETLRQVLYNDMPRRRRKRAHRKVVTALHKLYRDDLDRLSPVLAYHHHAVGDWRETLHWSTQALAAALERSDNDAAATVQSWAEDALAGARRVSSNERDRLELYSGMLFRRLGQLENATLRLLQVSEREETPLGVLARLELARCHMARGDLEAAVEITRGAGRAAEQLSESDSLHEAMLLEATCLLRLGQSQPAAALLDTLLASLGDRGRRTVRSLAHRERAWAFLNSGAFQEAQRHARRAHELARMAGDLLAQHHAVSALAAVLSNSGDPAGAVPLNRQALDLARRLSLRRREAIDLANLGELHYELRDPDQALDHFREALAIFVEIGDRACEGDCRVNVGRAMLARGDGHEALAMLQRGRALCESTGRAEYAGIALLHEGEAHLALGDPRGANAAYTEAQERFAEIDSHHLWRADLGRAQAERARGRQETALELARRAAQRVESQRTNLPAEAHSSGFDQAASAVSELIEAIESR